MVIFTRTYDFVSWLIPMTMNFPRAHRFVVTRRLQDAVLNFQERLIDANAVRGKVRADRLKSADAELLKIKLYLRLCNRWEWLSHSQYRHVSVMVLELGRLLGGWQKSVTDEPQGST